jgi:tetratricopeptide (TPR) repeat protein
MNMYSKKTARLVLASLLTIVSTQVVHSADIWKDPVFVNRFMGSYGVLSEVEPAIGPKDVELLKDILELIKVNPQAAIQRIRSEIKPDSSATFLFILGNLYFQSGDLPTAITQYEAALKKFPDFRRAHKNLGLVYVQSGNMKAAIPHICRSMELGDRDGRNFGLLGYCYLSENNLLAAEIAYRQAILQEPEEHDWKLGLARGLIGQQKFDEARIIFDSLIVAEPGNPEYRFLQANCYIGLGQYKEAAIDLEIAHDKGQPTRESLFLLANIYRNFQMLDVSLDAYKKAIALDVDRTASADAIQSISLFLQNDAPDLAYSLVQTIEDHYKGQLKFKDELALLHLKARVKESQGNGVQAREILEEIVQRDPLNGPALMTYADMLVQAGETEKAQFFLERAQKVESTRYQALVKMARLSIQKKHYKVGAQYLKDALSIKEDSRLSTYLKQIEGMESL